MSGGVVFTTEGRDEMVRILQDRISYFKLGEGGFILSGLTTEVIEPSASGSEDTYTYTITGGTFDIIGVNQGTQKFQIDGLYASYFPDGTRIKVEGSTGNDGLYTVAVGGATEAGGDTYIEVEESIPSAVADGLLYVNHLPVAKGPNSDAKHYPLVIEERTPGDSLVQSVTDTTGTGSLTGDGTGTVNYKDGALSVTFTANVQAGNHVQVVFKSHDTRKDASGGIGYWDLESSREFGIIGVDQGNKKFRINGEYASDFSGVPNIAVSDSTGNDGTYTIVAVTESGGDTYIEVSEAIPDATADGDLVPVSADGLPEFYTYQKSFGADVDTVITFRGIGYGTIRCSFKLQTWEGLDDGRAATYGGIPYYFEGGIFDDDDVLLAYFTFDKERKTGSIEIEHTVDFVI